MPNCAPFAVIPNTSTAPRFADTKASPVTHAGNDLPERKKSRLLEIDRRASSPIPSTITK
jgi:hypothetical protein